MDTVTRGPGSARRTGGTLAESARTTGGALAGNARRSGGALDAGGGVAGDALIVEVAPGVWVAQGSRDRWRRAEPHPDDLARAAALPQWRAAEFLAGRALLRHLLRATVPELAGEPVVAGERGRPLLAGAPGTGVSVSHDGDAVAAAVAPRRRVGVDVQLPPARPSDALLRRCLGAHADAVLTLPEARRAAELAWVWTAQESCVKAAGTGLSDRPWTIDVPPGARRGRWRDYAWTSLRTLSRTPLSCAFSAPEDASDATWETPCS
ncbi:4'-phosphopantetheinyl transferase family protein [Streptomyces flavalbus]|uniref:4'-phosphopantetheinyl transferase family protein n=1 Tax=Streptomyces flavalbus TaxID=2665155 RepID=A0ABW2W5C5_9ACTN